MTLSAGVDAVATLQEVVERLQNVGYRYVLAVHLDGPSDHEAPALKVDAQAGLQSDLRGHTRSTGIAAPLRALRSRRVSFISHDSQDVPPLALPASDV